MFEISLARETDGSCSACSSPAKYKVLLGNVEIRLCAEHAYKMRNMTKDDESLHDELNKQHSFTDDTLSVLERVTDLVERYNDLVELCETYRDRISHLESAMLPTQIDEGY